VFFSVYHFTLRFHPKKFIFFLEMGKFKKILLVILALIYVTHVYSRLVHTPPIYLPLSAGSSKCTLDNNFGKYSSSFILHRRHLPLIKKVEVGKLYPTLLQENISLLYSNKPIVVCIFSLVHFNLFDLNSFHNKAPPLFNLI